MPCKLCGENKKLIEAHIIPKSFYKLVNKSDSGSLIISQEPGEYPKRSPVGVYDKEIICENCEKIFAPWDDYGLKFFTKSLKEENYIKNGEERTAYNLGSCDFEKLSLFIYSVLLKASLSSQKLFQKVNLGPFEKLLIDSIINRQIPNQKIFSIVLYRFDAPPNQTGILNPMPIRYENVLHQRLYLGNYMCAVKVSKQTNPKCFDGIYLEQGKDVYFIETPFKESNEYRALLRTVRDSKNARKS